MADALQTITVTAKSPTVGPVRYPRGIVKMGSFGSEVAVSGWVRFTVNNNSHYEADTFQVEFAVSAMPADHDANWLSSQTEVFVQILAGFPANPNAPTPDELKPLIYGRIDDIDYQVGTEIIRISGRDLTGALIDDKSQLEYVNQTAKQIVVDIAKKHGLSYQAKDTHGFIGIPDIDGQTHLKSVSSHWELVAGLAQRVGFVTYVVGTLLYFGPEQVNPDDPDNVYTLHYQKRTGANAAPVSNAITLSFSRSLTIAKGISVTVRSAGISKKTVTASYPTAPKAITPGKASPYGSFTRYFFNMPAGATPAQAQRRAQELYNSLIQHEMKMRARFPADNLLSMQSVIRVQGGTGTAFDQTYFPLKITRKMDMEDGYDMIVDAQNRTPSIQPAPNPDDEGDFDSDDPKQAEEFDLAQDNP